MNAAGTSSARAGWDTHFTHGRGGRGLFVLVRYGSAGNHFTHGRGGRASLLLVRYGSQSTISRVCWPAVTISGVLLLYAAIKLPMALPVPAAVCRFTSAGLPVDCAKPSAIANTEASCRPKM